MNPGRRTVPALLIGPPLVTLATTTFFVVELYAAVPRIIAEHWPRRGSGRLRQFEPSISSDDVIERWVVVRQWREEMDYRAPPGMEAVVKVRLRSGEELIPVRVQVLGDDWVAFHTFAEDLADIEIVSVIEPEIAEVRCSFEPKATQPLGFSVEALSVATDESESSVTVDRF